MFVCMNWSLLLCDTMLMCMQVSGAERQSRSHGIAVILSNSSPSSLPVACLLCGSRGCDDTDVCNAFVILIH